MEIGPTNYTYRYNETGESSHLLRPNFCVPRTHGEGQLSSDTTHELLGFLWGFGFGGWRGKGLVSGLCLTRET